MENKININDLKNKLVKMNNRKKRKKYILNVLLIIVCFFIIVQGISIFNNLNDKRKINKQTEKINKVAEIINIVNEGQNINPPKSEEDVYWKYIKYDMIDVNIDNLKAINNEVVGWISVNNTNINYPIVQTTNNDFYLKHQLDKSKNTAGWVFMDYRNNKDVINNKNTIIYGHGLRNKAIFGTLKNALNESWYNNEENSVIKSVSENNSFLWQIFSIYKIDNTNDYIRTDFVDEKDYLDFLNMIKSRSIKDFNVELNNDDKIITLSTCYNNDIKMVVHAKLIKSN